MICIRISSVSPLSPIFLVHSLSFSHDTKTENSETFTFHLIAIHYSFETWDEAAAACRASDDCGGFQAKKKMVRTPDRKELQNVAPPNSGRRQMEMVTIQGTETWQPAVGPYVLMGPRVLRAMGSNQNQDAFKYECWTRSDRPMPKSHPEPRRPFWLWKNKNDASDRTPAPFWRSLLSHSGLYDNFVHPKKMAKVFYTNAASLAMTPRDDPTKRLFSVSHSARDSLYRMGVRKSAMEKHRQQYFQLVAEQFRLTPADNAASRLNDIPHAQRLELANLIGAHHKNDVPRARIHRVRKFVKVSRHIHIPKASAGAFMRGLVSSWAGSGQYRKYPQKTHGIFTHFEGF